MPGTKATKITLCVALIVAVVAVVFFFVFPWLSASLQPDAIVYRN